MFPTTIGRLYSLAITLQRSATWVATLSWVMIRCTRAGGNVRSRLYCDIVMAKNRWSASEMSYQWNTQPLSVWLKGSIEMATKQSKSARKMSSFYLYRKTGPTTSIFEHFPTLEYRITKSISQAKHKHHLENTTNRDNVWRAGPKHSARFNAFWEEYPFWMCLPKRHNVSIVRGPNATPFSVSGLASMCKSPTRKTKTTHNNKTCSCSVHSVSWFLWTKKKHTHIQRERKRRFAAKRPGHQPDEQKKRIHRALRQQWIPFKKSPENDSFFAGQSLISYCFSKIMFWISVQTANEI